MQGPYPRKRGVETTVDFTLFEVDGINFRTDAVHASGDTTIMKDEGAEANTTNGFTDEGQGYSIVLTATEMEAARIVVYVADQGTKVWLDTAIAIETYGHASALHAFDLDSATVTPADGSIDEDVLASDMDKYQAKVWMADDDSGANDRYVTVWFKNGEPVVSGITSPLIQVIKASDGTDLVTSTAQSQIATTGLYKYDEASNRLVNGAMYIAKVTATIDGAPRTWYQQVSRDS